MLDKMVSNRVLKEENRKWPMLPVEMPKETWPPIPAGLSPGVVRMRLLRSREFVIQIFDEHGTIRITVIRTLLDKRGRWKDGITWDELQQIKRWCGYADEIAVEIYPRESDVIDVANMRHLWILKEPLPFGWHGATDESER